MKASSEFGASSECETSLEFHKNNMDVQTKYFTGKISLEDAKKKLKECRIQIPPDVTPIPEHIEFIKHARKMGCSLSGDETLKYFEFLSPEESWDFFCDTGDYYSNTKDFFHSIVQKLVDYELPEHLKFFLHKAGDNIKRFDYFEYKEYRADKKILFLLQNSPLSIQKKVLELAPKYKKYYSQLS